MDSEDFEHLCDELRLFAENTGTLYPQVRVAVGKLAKDKEAGISEAQNLKKNLVIWLEICQTAAAFYQTEIDKVSFPRSVIKAVAEQWASDYLTRLNSGEEGLYD